MMRVNNKQRGDIEAFFGLAGLALIVIALVVALFWNIFVAYGTEAVVRGATVEKSERVCDGGKEGKCRYLIFTDKGVLKNTDTLLRGKFDSSDLYASIKVNQTYDFTTVGFRVPFFSMYPNVLKAAPVAK